MQIQMTERDKKLIVFLAIFVIVVAGGYWGIYPIISGIITTNIEIQDAQAKRDENEIKITQVSLIEMENENIEKEITSKKAKFFPMMTSDQVDKYMTGLILDYNLYAYDLNIVMPTEEAAMEPYQYSQRAEQLAMQENEEATDASAEDAATEDNGVTDSAEDAVAEWNSLEDVPTGIYAVSVTMRVGGSETDIQRLIDGLSVSGQLIHLSSYDWDSERSITYNDDGSYEITTQRTMTMNLILYMCEE